jgi:hypothetical protein
MMPDPDEPFVARPQDVKDIDLEQRRETKVRLPIHLHLKLQTLRIARKMPIGDVVRDALQEYFKKVDQERR